MILKKRRGSRLIVLALFGILLVTIVLATLAYNQNRTVLQANFFQRLQCLDLGFAQPQNLSTIVKKLPTILINKFTGFPGRPPIERIDIDIKFIDYQKLLRDRQTAISLNGLKKPVDVPASIRYQNKTIRAKIRLKGDLFDHWLSHYRMSLRVSLKGNNSILGFKKFSLHKPESRQFPFDHIYTESMQAIGNIEPRHSYIRVFMNGTSWGVMDIEEHISKELVEKQRAKESIIVRFGNEERGSLFATTKLKNKHYTPYRLSNPYLYVKLYDANDSLKNPINRKRLTYINEATLKRDHANLYDIDQYSRTLIMAALWNDGHPLYRSNSRHYFNPYTLELQPIPSDSVGPASISTYGFMPRKTFDPFLNNEIYTQIISTPEYHDHLQANFNAVILSLQNLGRIVSNIQAYFPIEANAFYPGILLANANTLKLNPEKYLTFPSTNDSILTLNNRNQPNLSETKQNFVHLVHRENGLLEIYNLIPDTVRITELKLGNKNILNGHITLEPYSPLFYKPKIVKTPIQGKQDGQLSVTAVYQTKSESHIIGPTLGVFDYYIPPRPKIIRLVKPTHEQASFLPDHLHVRHYENGLFEVYNLLPDTVSLEKILVDGKPHTFSPTTIPSFSNNSFSPVVLKTDIQGLMDSRLSVQTSYQGYVRTTQVGPTLVNDKLTNPLLVKTDNKIPYLQKTSDHDWLIPQGSWKVTKPLIIRGNLTIQPGTTLNFSENSYLLINHGKLTSQGTPSARIRFMPINNTWKGIYVSRAPERSNLSYSDITGTSELHDGLLDLTGAVTFYKSDINLDNVTFSENQAEDALNIVHSSFTIDKVNVSKAVSDGIDFDFSDGIITGSFFHNINGDALDFSGSKVTVRDTTITNIKDKGISAGEKSNINLSNLQIIDSGVGIASKDGSMVTGEHIDITNYVLHAVMAYKKKDFYGLPSANLTSLTATGTKKPYSAQHDSTMTINGIDISQEEVNVKQLYQTEMMKK